ncbi:MAG: ATP-binding cassette domain-containing protein, partial [Verrucomicrobia bacterium]
MSSNEAPIIEVVDLVRRFGDRTVLNDISFNVHRGETLVIMGGSGCGKSTLLRHMIGSMKPTSGSVKIFGEEIATMKEREIGRVRQRFGMLFQSGALLASLTVGENVALPLFQHTEKSPDEIEEIVKQKLQMVGLTGFEDLKPAEISGGMKKRVGLARALALDPELLFSDEPTSGLDPIMTAVVDQLTLKLAHGSHMTAVVVSHDMTSAFRIATRMIMLGHGSIVAQGTPEEIRTSTNPEVHQFINGEADGRQAAAFRGRAASLSSQNSMKRNLSDYVVAISVILCSLVLLGALTVALSGYRLKKPKRTLQINYEDVTGIKVNSEVRYAGAPAGRVIAMRHLTAKEREASPNKMDAVRVTVSLDEGIPPLPTDVTATLSSDTLLAPKFVALSAGTPGGTTLADNAAIEGHPAYGLEQITAAAGPLFENANKLLDNLNA